MKLLCPNCGTQHESGKFCPECGGILQEVTPELVCPSCGYKAQTGKFCPECGTKLTEQIVSSEEPAKKETAERKFNERDPRFAKYYDRKGFPRVIPQEERDVAIEELTPFAKQNITEAKMLLGNAIISNASNEDEEIKAVKLIKEAEQEGDKFAYYMMSIGYTEGWDGIVEQDHNEAEKRLLEAYQEYQDGSAAVLLANLYTFSSEKCDYKKAFEYATIAAEDDKEGGYFVLGALYLNGWGVTKDVQKALENYKMSAAYGNATAMNHIGFINMGIDDFEANPEQSFYWFNEATKKGSDVGMFNLGCCYRDGFGIEADLEKAAEWFKKAAELGYLDAMCELGNYYQDTLADYNKAKMWYLKAAEFGNPEAQNKLGVLCADIDNDYKEAIKWYKAAMEQDNSYAYRNYAFSLWNGNGITENKKEAIEMMKKAISLGHPDAENELDEMQQELANSKKEYAKDSQPKKKQVKEKTEDVIIKNVNFSTDGRKTLFMEFDCEYNREFDDYAIFFNVYANNIHIDSPGVAYGNGTPLSKNREKFRFQIPSYRLDLAINKINNISFKIEVRQLDERWDGTQDLKTFQLIASCENKLKLYYEFHFFNKNILEIK